MNTGVSIIICCYNSSARLPKTLEYLANQQVNSCINWEVIIVDNASTDGTAQVAEREWIKYQLDKIKIVTQPLLGLSNARKKGIEESLYDLLIFCDDDNWLFPTYVQTAFELSQRNEKVGAIGGTGVAVSDIQLPEWFDAYKTYYACYPQASESGELLEPSSFLYGAGLIVKKEKLLNLYAKGFEVFTTDRIGASLTSGGDNELCYALRLTGCKLYYSDDLRFYHYIPQTRLTKDYLLKLIKAISYSSMHLILYHYALAGKKINRFTWLKDALYRSYVFALSTTSRRKDPFGESISRYSSYQALIAVINLFGSYRKNYKRLMALK